MTAQRCRQLLPGLWAGLLLCVALVATPAPFATLAAADAGRVVARILMQEAWASLALSTALLLLERGPKRRGHLCVLGLSVACTLLGYFGVQALLPAARAGAGAFTFGQLHLLSVALFAVKLVLVLWLAWRAAAPDPALNRLFS